MRVLLVGRFVVYAVVIVLGVMHLLGRESAPAHASMPRESWVQGETSQKLRAWTKTENGRVVGVSADWRVTCRSGSAAEEIPVQANTFEEGYRGDFRRTGSRFTHDWHSRMVGLDGRPYSISAQLTGEDSPTGARGTMHFVLTYEYRGQPGICDSGPILWHVKG